MNKSELVTAVVEKTHVAKKDVDRVVNALIDTVGEALVSGEDVALVGFGTFHVRETAARVGRNPQTGAELQIPAKKVPAFKPGKSLKEKLG